MLDLKDKVKLILGFFRTSNAPSFVSFLCPIQPLHLPPFVSTTWNLLAQPMYMLSTCVLLLLLKLIKAKSSSLF